MIFEGGGEQSVGVISEDGVASGLKFSEFREWKIVILAVGLEQPFSGREEDRLGEEAREGLGKRAGRWHRRMGRTVYGGQR